MSNVLLALVLTVIKQQGVTNMGRKDERNAELYDQNAFRSKKSEALPEDIEFVATVTGHSKNQVMVDAMRLYLSFFKRKIFKSPIAYMWGLCLWWLAFAIVFVMLSLL